MQLPKLSTIKMNYRLVRQYSTGSQTLAEQTGAAEASPAGTRVYKQKDTLDRMS
jgi:hypothetical protein